MLLGVVSDSHLSEARITAAAERLQGADRVIHLGDMTRDGRMLEKRMGRPVIRVAGNCDVLSGEPWERTERFGGLEVFLCHGHTLRVKENILPLELRALECGAQIALFGHTHQPFEAIHSGVLLVNPGALKDGWLALVETEGLRVQHVRV